jgi:mono/diheme cytochrome c family protein
MDFIKKKLPKTWGARLNLIAKLLVGCWLLAFLPIWVVGSFLQPTKAPRLIQQFAPPIIQAEPQIQDIGHVKTDGHAVAVFRLVNLGGRSLQISQVEASCGCTVAKLSKKIIPPGQMATLDVNLDTSLKLGRVEKQITVTTNDPKSPQYLLTLLAWVDPNFKGHEKIAVKNRLVLFQGKCASCHVNKGVGKSGESLFNADCAMCHGVAGKGRVSPALIIRFRHRPDARYHDPAFLNRFKEVITSGSPNNPSMPPFGVAHGGPLTDSQIDSLVTYLQYLAETE